MSSSTPQDASLDATPKKSIESKDDSLLECLLIICKYHQISTSRDALVAGLPLAQQTLTPSLFKRAASRAHLSSTLQPFTLEAIPEEVLPVILLLKQQQACVLVSLDKSNQQANVIFPEHGLTEIQMSFVELLNRFDGYAWVVRPEYRFDQRAPEIGNIKLKHWFWSVIAENKKIYRDVMFAALLINLFALAMPMFTMNVYDRVVPNKSVESLLALSSGIVIVIFGDMLLRTLRGHFLDWSSKLVDKKLSSVIMERVLGIRLEFRPQSVGSFASNLRSFETVRDFITSTTITAFIDIPFALIFIAVIGWVAWQMVFPVLIGALLMLVYAMSTQTKMHELSETTYRAGAMKNAVLIESLVGLETIKSLGIEGVMQSRWERNTAFVAEVGSKLKLLSATINYGSNVIQQIVTVAMVYLGVYLITDNQMTMGGLIAATMLSSRALAPIAQATTLLTQYHNAATALNSLESVMSQPVERPTDSTFLSRKYFAGDIEFREVSFAYPGAEQQALRNASFKIKAGEHVAILGRVGSGKTTLHKLILGLFQPTSGAVLIDGIDLRQLDPAEVRRNVGYVQQDTQLFYGSLKENLTLGAPHADDASILHAARIGGIDEFVNMHPKGFDMPVGERGETLSGGQRQGVGIARAMIVNPSIVLLDEPTSAMDHSSEELVKQRLKQELAGKTTILISHRSSLFDLVDRIIVIDGGRIMADGPKNDIIDALRAGRIGKAL